jgi:hypothetical protein
MRTLRHIEYPELPPEVAQSPLGLVLMNVIAAFNNNLGAITDHLTVISEQIGLNDRKYRARLDTLPEFVEREVDEKTKHGFTELELKLVRAGAERMFVIKVTVWGAVFGLFLTAAYEWIKLKVGHP